MGLIGAKEPQPHAVSLTLLLAPRSLRSDQPWRGRKKGAASSYPGHSAAIAAHDQLGCYLLIQRLRNRHARHAGLYIRRRT